MRAELLFFSGCPQRPPTEARLRSVLSRLAPEAELTLTDVRDEAHALEMGFLGSPSIRIDGRDIETGAEGPALFGCRLYPEGPSPAPWRIEAAVLRGLAPHHILFLCVANSARSQMAEGIARSLAPPEVRISSAGSEPTQVRPEAIAALAEIGIDIEPHHSKPIAELEGHGVDTVITLCAEEVCPTWLEPAHRVHWGLPDPASVEDRDARQQAFCEVRDELRVRLSSLLG